MFAKAIPATLLVTVPRKYIRVLVLRRRPGVLGRDVVAIYLELSSAPIPDNEFPEGCCLMSVRLSRTVYQCCNEVFEYSSVVTIIR